jgi:hypothetical protein
MPVPGYNPSNTEDYSVGYKEMPDGSHPVMITKHEYKKTRNGGDMLTLEIECIDGPNKGVKVFENLNVVNSNEVAQNIAHSKLKGYFAAVGSPESIEEGDLMRKPFGIKTKTKQNGEYRNTDIFILDDIPGAGAQAPIQASTIDDDIPF